VTTEQAADPIESTAPAVQESPSVEAIPEVAVAEPSDNPEPAPLAEPTKETDPVNEPAPEPLPAETIPSTAAEEESPAATVQAPSPTPWMHGVQVPPPRLFSSAVTPDEPPPAPAPAEPVSPPPAPAPEAKRTADFLANQPGVFAAAVFVEGAVYASETFPPKPDLDALCDFMAAIIDETRESAQRLGWNGTLTIACDQFHLTAVVRETHFVAALHYDRVLSSLAHETLVAAADELGKD
jgi:hypothetical protein